MRLVVCCAWIMMCCQCAWADVADSQWPSFRGPANTGAAAEADPPITWSSTDNLKWKVEIPGRGSSSPIVWEDKIFVTTAVPTGKAAADLSPKKPRSGRRRGRRPRIPPTEQEFMAICYSRSTGETLWSKTLAVGTPSEPPHPDNTFASASPSTDGTHLIVSFGSQGLFCLDFAGEIVWERKDLGNMTTRGSFGEGSSPALYRDTVVLPWDHEGDSYIEAINKLTGETIWKVNREEPSNWVTPLVVEHDGVVQIVQSGQERARGYDFATGKELWNFSGLSQRPISTPVVYDNFVMFASSRGGSFMGAVDLTGRGDLNGSDSEAWTVEKATPDIPSLLLLEDRIYFLAGNTGVISSVSAKSGEFITKQKRLGNIRAVYASPVAAHGRIYVTGRDGKTMVLEDSPELTVLAENEIDEPVDATPAIIGKQLYLRSSKHLFCFEASE